MLQSGVVTRNVGTHLENLRSIFAIGPNVALPDVVKLIKKSAQENYEQYLIACEYLLLFAKEVAQFVTPDTLARVESDLCLKESFSEFYSTHICQELSKSSTLCCSKFVNVLMKPLKNTVNSKWSFKVFSRRHFSENQHIDIKFNCFVASFVFTR